MGNVRSEVMILVCVCIYQRFRKSLSDIYVGVFSFVAQRRSILATLSSSMRPSWSSRKSSSFASIKVVSSSKSNKDVEKLMYYVSVVCLFVCLFVCVVVQP